MSDWKQIKTLDEFAKHSLERTLNQMKEKDLKNIGDKKMAINAKMQVSLDEDDLKEIVIDFLKAKGMTFSKDDIRFDSTSKVVTQFDWDRDVIVKVSASKDL